MHSCIIFDVYLHFKMLCRRFHYYFVDQMTTYSHIKIEETEDVGYKCSNFPKVCKSKGGLTLHDTEKETSRGQIMKVPNQIMTG